MEPEKEPVYSVSEITLQIKQTLEQGFAKVQVKGELSNIRPSGSGHLFFSLKDDTSVLSGVMFRGRRARLRFKPVDGMLVIASGNISVYPQRGTYQLICEHLTLAGEGTILAMLEERKRKLAEEGLFDEKRKQKLPLLPSKIAVVTSSTGAAIRDILRVLRRRNAGINLVVLPSLVQGEGAGEQIAAQIRRANMFDLGEVLIVGRGGGSLEDLLPFSDEAVVRAISESKIPVISAVGHEIDTTLSDLAADVRAPTPSAAAEIVTANRDDIMKRLKEMEAIIHGTLKQRIEQIKLLLRQFTPQQMERNFLFILQPVLLRLDDCKEGMLRGMKELLREKSHRISILQEKLLSNSPKEILKKGYALVEDKENGRMIRKAGQTGPGRRIKVAFYESSLSAQVEEIEP
jgi:exodeoxyribonuclease VII large subunit